MKFESDLIIQRALINNKIRQFFEKNNYIEVDTPLLSPTLIPEHTIEIFKTRMKQPGKKDLPLYLIPSPEVWMKQLIADGVKNIFQICHSFRNSEQSGKIHNPEFTMLEWYADGADYIDNIKITENLFQSILPENAPDYLKPPFITITMEEAFIKYGGFSLLENISKENLVKQAELKNIYTSPTDSLDDIFQRIFISLVEPNLPTNHPLVIIDYPSFIPTLAKNKEGTPWSQRWELYVKGIELANCYTEEDRPEKILDYYKSEQDHVEKYKKNQINIIPEIPTVDNEYYKLFRDFKPCSGTAMGIDRFLMLLSNREDLRGVILFPINDTID